MIDGVEYRHHTFFKQRIYELGIHAFRSDISDKSVVDAFAEALDMHRSPFCRLDRIAVRSTQADRIAAFGLQQCCDVLAAPSGIHHSDDLQSLLIGHPSALDHLRYHPHRLLHLARHHSAAMHQHLHARHSREIPDKLPQQLGIVYNISSYLDNFNHVFSIGLLKFPSGWSGRRRRGWQLPG